MINKANYLQLLFRQ